MGGTAAIIGIITTIVGAGGTVYSHMQAADARDDERDRLREMAKRDAEIHDENTKKMTAKQRALFAASGVRVDDGSPLAVVAQSQADAAEEREEIMKAYGYRGDALKTDASRIRTSGVLSGAGTLLGGAASYATSPYGSNPFAAGPTYTPSYPLSGPTHHSR